MKFDAAKGWAVLTPDETEYFKQAFVREGHVTLRMLGRKGTVQPIPDGECAITALCRDAHGKIFGLTSGKRTHLFVYAPGPCADYVVDLGVLGEGLRSPGALAASSDGVVYAGTRREGGEGKLFRYVPGDELVWEWGYSLGTVEDLSTPIAGEGITSLAVDNVSGVLYGLSDRSGTLFAHDLSGGAGAALGRVEGAQGGGAFLVPPSDERALRVVAENGSLAQYSRESRSIDSLAPLPLSAEDKVSAVVDAGPRQGIFIGTCAGNVLLWNGQARRIGRAPLDYPVRAMTVGAGAELYGIAGKRGGMCHLFVASSRGNVRDLGAPFATVERYWHGYEFDAMETGTFGEIYLGESDRISHLFIFHPPVGGNHA